MGIGRIMAIEAGRGVDGHNWSGSYWKPRKTSTGFHGSLKCVRIDPPYVTAQGTKHVFTLVSCV